MLTLEGACSGDSKMVEMRGATIQIETVLNIMNRKFRNRTSMIVRIYGRKKDRILKYRFRLFSSFFFGIDPSYYKSRQRLLTGRNTARHV